MPKFTIIPALAKAPFCHNRPGSVLIPESCFGDLADINSLWQSLASVGRSFIYNDPIQGETLQRVYAVIQNEQGSKTIFPDSMPLPSDTTCFKIVIEQSTFKVCRRDTIANGKIQNNDTKARLYKTDKTIWNVPMPPNSQAPNFSSYHVWQA